MKDYSIAQLYDIQRKSSLEICKRLLNSDKTSTSMDVFLRLSVDLTAPSEEKNLPNLVTIGLQDYLKNYSVRLPYGSSLLIRESHVSRAAPSKLEAA